ncbi:MAG: hypothetical protein E3K32_07505 [wastewater metagenome]|nr:hypothetical protein [Candidatus Loosdrechtia aerotolerans]
MRNKNNDTLVLKIRELREKIRGKVREEHLKECEEYRNLGKYYWEGLWVTPQNIKKIQKVMKKRDRIIFLEILILFIISGLLSYILYRLMKVFLLP